MSAPAGTSSGLSKADCIAALHEVAEHLGTRELSRDVYERSRAAMPSPLPHLATITKLLGAKSWAEALGRAGLKPTAHAVRCRTKGGSKRAALLDDLRAAWWQTDGGLLPWRYAAWLAGMPERERVARAHPRSIVRALGSWPAALEAAGILPDDAFHPSARERAGDPALMWMVGDVRRLILGFARRHGGRFPTEETWCVRPGGTLPSWQVVCDLMPPQPWAIAGAPVSGDNR